MPCSSPTNPIFCGRRLDANRLYVHFKNGHQCTPAFWECGALAWGAANTQSSQDWPRCILCLDQFPCVAKQNLAVNALVSSIRVWEMGADVAKCKGSKKGITNDMEQHIRIAVTN